MITATFIGGPHDGRRITLRSPGPLLIATPTPISYRADPIEDFGPTCREVCIYPEPTPWGWILRWPKDT